MSKSVNAKVRSLEGKSARRKNKDRADKCIPGTARLKELHTEEINIVDNVSTLDKIKKVFKWKL